MKTFIFILIAPCALAFQPVDLNRASFEQIALLPAVGKKLAQNMVAFRKKQGALNLASLSSVPGMTEQKLLAIKDKIIFSSVVHRPKNDAGQKNRQEKKPVIPWALLQESILLVHGLHDSRDASLRNRVRKAAFLPQLTTFVDSNHDAMTTVKSLEKQKDSALSRGSNGIGFGVKLVFDLEKLVFRNEELEVEKLILKRLEKRDELIKQLHKLYFSYIRLNERFPDLATELEMREIAAQIDALTGFAFTEYQSSAVSLP